MGPGGGARGSRLGSLRKQRGTMRPSALVALRAARGGSGGLSRPTLRQLSSSAPPPPPPAQTAAPDASRFPQPPQPRRSVGGGREMDTRDLMHTRAFLGYEARVTHPANYRYLLGSLGGHAIIDPEATMLSLRKARSRPMRQLHLPPGPRATTHPTPPNGLLIRLSFAVGRCSASSRRSPSPAVRFSSSQRSPSWPVSRV